MTKPVLKISFASTAPWLGISVGVVASLPKGIVGASDVAASNCSKVI